MYVMRVTFSLSCHYVGNISLVAVRNKQYIQAAAHSIKTLNYRSIKTQVCLKQIEQLQLLNIPTYKIMTLYWDITVNKKKKWKHFLVYTITAKRIHEQSFPEKTVDINFKNKTHILKLLTLQQ